MHAWMGGDAQNAHKINTPTYAKVSMYNISTAV